MGKISSNINMKSLSNSLPQKTSMNLDEIILLTEHQNMTKGR